jgi:aryl-alcohol dehydrogenase-like predicted oxidoreductase
VNGVSRRSVPGSPLRASLLGFTIDPPNSASPTWEDRTIRLLHTARANGVTTFRVGGEGSGPRVERLLAAAFREPDPELIVIVPGSLAGLTSGSVTGHGGSARDLESRLRSSLEESRRRLAPLRLSVLEWHFDSTPQSHDSEVVQMLDRLRASDLFGTVATVIVPWESDRSVPSASALVTAPLSALDARLLPDLDRRASGDPFGVFVVDPLGGGRLDGSRFSASLAERRPDEGPMDVRELERAAAPVLRLGFLTADRRRTLAQAALQFVYRWPWVVAALPPLPGPERLDEFVRAERVPPLTDAEVERVLAPG